ncbi:MAG: hypothetical protein H0X37_17555 [Herpetosiphonaceae bacterium]|nr:hypothetical protein [Herpetosiphonaceae bacterium]
MSLEPQQLIQLVITVPAPYTADLAYMTRTRMTVGVLTVMIADAQRELVIAAPYLQRDEGLSRPPLSDALDAALARGVQIHIASTAAALQTLSVGTKPDDYSGQIHLYQPLTNRDDPTRLGSHAKFCLADSEQAYIGSANLTRPGLGEHLELGVLVTGERAQQVQRFWRYLLQIGFFVRVN